MKKLLLFLLATWLFQACGTTDVCSETSPEVIVLFKIGILPQSDCNFASPLVGGNASGFTNSQNNHGEKFLKLDFLYSCTDGCLIDNKFMREDLKEFSPDIFGTNFTKNNVSGKIRLEADATTASGSISASFREKCHSGSCFMCENLDGSQAQFFNQYADDPILTSILFQSNPAPITSWNLFHEPELDVIILLRFMSTGCCDQA
jgi:hypothetical protein